MAVIITKSADNAFCACCGSGKHKMHEFQFFQDVNSKQCITLCNYCVHMLDNTVLEEVCNNINNGIKEQRKHELQTTTRVP